MYIYKYKHTYIVVYPYSHVRTYARQFYAKPDQTVLFPSLPFPFSTPPPHRHDNGNRIKPDGQGTKLGTRVENVQNNHGRMEIKKKK